MLVLVRPVELDRGEDALGRRDLVAAALGLDEEDAVVALPNFGLPPLNVIRADLLPLPAAGTW